MQDKKVAAFIASTAVQVNYCARLIQALGVHPAGFSDKCDI